MSLFGRKRQDVEKQDAEASREVRRLKAETHKTAMQADRDIRKLNSLLRANGITLQIYHATGGGHGH